jgi:hypothetical protein
MFLWPGATSPRPGASAPMPDRPPAGAGPCACAGVDYTASTLLRCSPPRLCHRLVAQSGALRCIAGVQPCGREVPRVWVRQVRHSTSAGRSSSSGPSGRERHWFSVVGVWACLVQERQGVISRRLIARSKREPVAIELSRQYTGGNVPMRQSLYRAKGRCVSRQDRYLRSKIWIPSRISMGNSAECQLRAMGNRLGPSGAQKRSPCACAFLASSSAVI